MDVRVAHHWSCIARPAACVCVLWNCAVAGALTALCQKVCLAHGPPCYPTHTDRHTHAYTVTLRKAHKHTHLNTHTRTVRTHTHPPFQPISSAQGMRTLISLLPLSSFPSLLSPMCPCPLTHPLFSALPPSFPPSNTSSPCPALLTL